MIAAILWTIACWTASSFILCSLWAAIGLSLGGRRTTSDTYTMEDFAVTERDRDKAFDVLLDRFVDPEPLQDDQREQVYKSIADTLADSGIPWPRAVELAERCLQSIRKIL